MRIVIAVTGASGAIYLQRLLHYLDGSGHELHLVFSAYAKQVIHEEIGELQIPAQAAEHSDKGMNAPFASGSKVRRNGRRSLLHGHTEPHRPWGERKPDPSGGGCFPEERRKLILVPRETPWSLVHARNAVAAIEAGAILLPASPSFYSRPATLAELADTVVWRILDQLGLDDPNACRWRE
jgi:4-hydroxy-3-polyprenylbenzoate decarboxylase